MGSYLSLCAIMRNEGPYLHEWLLYHRVQGVEHFYLYNNESTDNTEAVARDFDYVYGGVTLVNISGCPAQFRAYEDCLKTAKGKSRWIGFLDIDEFLVCKYWIPAMLKYFEAAPALGIHWKLFGSNGQKVYKNIPVVERFTRCQPDVNRHIKCIVNPERSFSCHTAHLFTHDALIVDEHNIQLPRLDPTPENGTCDIIQLNHYAVKSYNECMERRSRPRTDTGKVRENLTEFFKAHDRNEVEDLRARDFWRTQCVK